MLSRRVLLAWPAAGALAAAPGVALAGPDGYASPWSEGSHSAVRLVDGGRDGAVRLTAVEIKLPKNFKTYWRDPGDSGVPPRFDWTGSENVAAIEVVWPAPERFEDGAGWSIGYAGRALLPVRITVKDPAAPVRLSLRIDYAVCEMMCIPAQGQASLTLDPAGGGPYARQVADALARAPVAVAVGAAGPGGLSIAGVKLAEGPKPAVFLYAATPAGEPFDLFIEGPKGSFFGRPKAEPSHDPGKRRLIVPIEERAKGLARWPLKLTLVSGRHAIEVDGAIDAPPAK